MPPRTSVLCPVDFSDASRGALRYAAAAARRFETTLTIATIIDPLLMEAAKLSAPASDLPAAIRKELERFCEDTLEPAGLQEDLQYEVATGKPAVEILRLAKARPGCVIVMSTHGLTGVRKLFFGSTTERVLRETTVPILLTPAHDHGPVRTDDIKGRVRRLLVPVDLSDHSAEQVAIAGDIALAVDVPVILAHVVEPVRFAIPGLPHVPSIDAERRSRAEKEIGSAARSFPPGVRHEALVAYGDPAEEIAKVARDRNVGLIVIGLHGSALLGPRMGSVTYRVLCLTTSLVLALPPRASRLPLRSSVALVVTPPPPGS
jgi:nucleotide-binding universal stress UspA family protein